MLCLSESSIDLITFGIYSIYKLFLSIPCQVPLYLHSSSGGHRTAWLVPSGAPWG